MKLTLVCFCSCALLVLFPVVERAAGADVADES
jgi:hypothetical protein